ncbi:hypothetical protein [Sutcliffiella rhizosphaerae]|uniref:Uncharacterized protein n=1 Tax=Sutcliffiella rhizosphaerae TaxID=2880967 RepID=A0ABM8YNB2_9BACI|nr:hypothetical protein [Sutcliffiella rhizosphaerae]CAG9621393.1 hypothetical protein BACCIP111883_02166 [Sutcliffiella rhizosphaerae]
MVTVTGRLLPFAKNIFSFFKKLRPKWNWSEFQTVMNAYGLRLIFLTCLSPIITIIPALTFKIAIETSSIIGYLLALILLLPWVLIPTLFIQHISNRSKFGKTLSYGYAVMLIVSFFLWIYAIT